MSKETSPKLELGFSIFLLVLSIIIFRETLSLPPGTFDPVGSAGFPRLISAAIGILSLTVLIRAARRILSGSKNAATSATQKDADSPTFRRRPDLALGFYALSLVYVSVLALRLISFGICTALFLLTSIGMLTRFNYKRLPIALLIALVIGFGCQYIFTQVFVLDLP
ncbi:MAG TPA: tripartite tricarboxylate transporter TctB family protein [Spirochaetia bacterium]|nr:tripartite tricarboxylate transporter TctB family protein [Spirochaetia bacterium]